MKKALYKTMYEQIQLNEMQKNNIRSKLNQRKKARFKVRRLPAYAAACLCVLILSNIVVFAAEQIHLGEWIATELDHFPDTKRNLSEEQISTYDRQSIKLEQAIPLEHGTLMFESMLCDSSYVYLPYTFFPNSEEYLLRRPHKMNEANLLAFTVKGEKLNVLSQISYVEPKLQYEKTIHGSILLSGTFHQNSIIQVYSPHTTGSLEKPICELPPLNKLKNVQNIPFNAQEIKEKTNIEITQITLSPLSIQITGNSGQFFTTLSTVQLQIERKDGTTVKKAQSGSSGNCKEENDRYSFQYNQLFESPVSPDDLKGIRILLKNGTECWIPIK